MATFKPALCDVSQLAGVEENSWCMIAVPSARYQTTKTLVEDENTENSTSEVTLSVTRRARISANWTAENHHQRAG